MRSDYRRRAEIKRLVRKRLAERGYRGYAYREEGNVGDIQKAQRIVADMVGTLIVIRNVASEAKNKIDVAKDAVNQLEKSIKSLWDMQKLPKEFLDGDGAIITELVQSLYDSEFMNIARYAITEGPDGSWISTRINEATRYTDKLMKAAKEVSNKYK